MLALAGARMDARLCSNGRRLAPPPQFDQSLFQAAAWLWQRRGATGRQMAQQIQQCGPSDVAGAYLWQGGREALFSAIQNLPWGVGQRPVSVRLRAQPRSLAINDAYAGVVLIATDSG